MDPVDVLAALTEGWSVFQQLNQNDLDKEEKGCLPCGGANKTTKCLYRLLQGLQRRYDLSVYDDTTERLYTKIRTITG